MAYRQLHHAVELREIDAEFLCRARPSRFSCARARRDIEIDANGDRGSLVKLDRDFADLEYSQRNRFDIELIDPGRKRRLDLVAALADAGIHDLLR